MDVLFCETVSFTVGALAFYRCRTAQSQEEVLRALMAEVGVELIDYGSFTVQPCKPPIPIDQVLRYFVAAYSKAYRERVEREAARR